MLRSQLSTPESNTKLEQILRVAARCFAETGFEATSMRDVSRATGISLSGLYYYFRSKQYLLYLIQIKCFSDILDGLQARLAVEQDPASRLRALVQNHIEYFLSHPNEMKVLAHEEEALEQPLREEVDAIKRRYYASARGIFDEITADEPAPGINGRVAVLSLFGMMNWVYKWHKPEVDPCAEELTAAIVGIFLHGVAPGIGSSEEAFAGKSGASKS